MKLVKIQETRMGDWLYVTVGDEEIVGGGRVIVRDSSPHSKKDVLTYKVVEDEQE